MPGIWADRARGLRLLSPLPGLTPAGAPCPDPPGSTQIPAPPTARCPPTGGQRPGPPCGRRWSRCACCAARPCPPRGGRPGFLWKRKPQEPPTHNPSLPPLPSQPQSSASPSPQALPGLCCALPLSCCEDLFFTGLFSSPNLCHMGLYPHPLPRHLTVLGELSTGAHTPPGTAGSVPRP